MTIALPEMVIDPAAAGFDGDVLAPVPVTDAARRVLAFCTEPRSGWVTYHLAARSTRTSSLFDQVTTWSLLYANALASRVDIEDVAGFSRHRRRDFAARVAAVPEDTDRHTMDDDGVAKVVGLCHFGYHGVWGSKIMLPCTGARRFPCSTDTLRSVRVQPRGLLEQGAPVRPRPPREQRYGMP